MTASGVPDDAPGSRRVLVTGGAGTVGGWLVRTVPGDVDLHVTEHLSPVPDDVRAAATVHRVDLRSVDAATDLLEGVLPGVVVHTAYAQDRRDAIVDMTHAVASAADAVGSSIVALSTDVVFAGDDPPYDESADPDPVSDYGRWKAEAERCCVTVSPDACIVRISMAVSLDPPDRVTAALAAALRDGREVTLFEDELRQPIRARDLAEGLWALVAVGRVERAGIWHLPGPERLDRVEIGLRVAAALGLDAATVRVASASSFPSPRPRDPELVSTRRSPSAVTLPRFDTR